MKRKINLVGQNTLTVSLPKKWVEKNNIQKGDEIEVEEENNNLILGNNSNKENTKIKECEIKFGTEKITVIRSILGAYYRSGYDIIKITYDDEKIYTIIQEATNQLIGFDIIERGKQRCTIKSYLKEDKEELETTITRMINTIKTCQNIVKEDYENNTYDRIKELEEYRYSCWKLRDLSMRILTKKNLFREKSYGHIIMLWTLEKINRNYKRMYKSMKENNIKPDKEILKIYNEHTKLLEIFFQSINKFNIKNVEELHKEHDIQVEKIFSIMHKAAKNNITLSYILENIRRVQDMTTLLIVIHE